MTLRETIKSEIDALPEETLNSVYDYVCFQRFKKVAAVTDSEYLASVPGMMEYLIEAESAPDSEYVNLEAAWPDVLRKTI